MNTPLPYLYSPRCQASTKSRKPCSQPALKGQDLCWIHARKHKPGPKTEEGLERCKFARWKNGLRSAEYALLRRWKKLLFMRIDKCLIARKKKEPCEQLEISASEASIYANFWMKEFNRLTLYRDILRELVELNSNQLERWKRESIGPILSFEKSIKLRD